jgi:hypothetical protein
MTRPVGRPSMTKIKRFYEDIEYQAQSWEKPRLAGKIRILMGVCQAHNDQKRTSRR